MAKHGERKKKWRWDVYRDKDLEESAIYAVKRALEKDWSWKEVQLLLLDRIFDAKGDQIALFHGIIAARKVEGKGTWYIFVVEAKENYNIGNLNVFDEQFSILKSFAEHLNNNTVRSSHVNYKLMRQKLGRILWKNHTFVQVAASRSFSPDVFDVILKRRMSRVLNYGEHFVAELLVQ